MPGGFSLDKQRKESLLQRFSDLCKTPIEQQVEFFLKSFIFALGNNWKDVLALSDKFRKYVKEGGESAPDLNPVQAADFLQKYGLTRTASQRTAELKDVDLNSDNRITFIEYLLLHFKVMILREFYKRTNLPEEENLEDGGIGLTGVGMKLLDQLFTQPMGLDPGNCSFMICANSSYLLLEVEKAIEDFTRVKREREDKISVLEAKAMEGNNILILV